MTNEMTTKKDYGYFTIEVVQNDLDMDGKTYVKLSMIHIDPSYRGQGLGKKLMAEALESLKSFDLPIILVACPQGKDIDLERLVEFYQGFGFEVDEDYADCPYPIMYF